MSDSDTVNAVDVQRSCYRERSDQLNAVSERSELQLVSVANRFFVMRIILTYRE